MQLNMVKMQILANANLNIADLLNKSRGDVAYTIIDLDGDICDETLDAVRKIDGVLSLRCLGPACQ